MMVDNRVRKRGMFAVLLLLLGAVLLAVQLAGGIPFVTQSEMAPPKEPSVRLLRVPEAVGEQGMCMGVPILTEQEAEAFTELRGGDFSGCLEFSGVPAPVDAKNGIVYISQAINAAAAYTDLQGELQISLPRYELYFAPDEAFSDLAVAMAEGHIFRLLIADTQSGAYTDYGLVFTNLPVIRLDGGFSHFDKDGENALTGTLGLFSSDDPDEGGYCIKSSRASWHLRGATTSRQPKKSWKIDLIDGQRKNVELAMLGLGADDDWVLNSMSLDDTRMKERLAMDVWNELAAATADNDSMSVGRYVELVINGEYCGVYLLQRRIDETYLQLGEQDLLLKGKNTWSIASPADGYEIEYSPLSERETYAVIAGWADQTNCSAADVDNFIDVNLFVQWGSMTDNSSYNNIYYVLQPNGEGYRMYMVPWDTDYSMGVLWYNDFFSYQQDLSVEIVSERVEYDTMKVLYPDLDKRTAERWFALRESVYAREAVAEKLREYRARLCDSGALARDRALWGTFYGDEDSFENLNTYFDRRMEFLDAYYADKLT